jgi:ubiquitin
MATNDKQPRHRCSKCGATRDEKYMQVARETAKMKFWRCMDCDTNRKGGGLIFNGVQYSALLITYNP